MSLYSGALMYQSVSTPTIQALPRCLTAAAAPRPNRLEFGPREISTASMLYASIGILLLLEKFPTAMFTPLPLMGLPRVMTSRMCPG